MLNRLNNDFVGINEVFWDRYKELDTDNLLLVETSDHPVINHANAVVAKIIAQAKHLRIAWLKDTIPDDDVMYSYSASSIFLEYPKINLFMKSWFLFNSIFYYLFYVAIINRLLSFRYKSITYGDFVYDGYLSACSMATLHRFDVRIIKIFYIVLLRDSQAREILLNEDNIKAILVAHHIGLKAGPLSRVALQMNIPVYWKGGGHEIINLSVFNSLSQIYDYPLKPTPEDLDNLARNFNKTVESDFKEFIDQVNNPYYGALSVAYDNVVSSDMSRGQFLKEMGFEDKPIIFIMLHAFNDHPHSHFREMLFDDYYDWFAQTLKFAISDKSKNWVFKEHPANDFYPTKDIDLKKIFSNTPEHIKFVSCKSKVNAATVLNVADIIVTCIGTAGVEMPALRGIPSVTAGDSFFDGLGFTIEPKSKREYSVTLQNIFPEKLSLEQQLRAKCCYLYIKKYSSVPFAAGPPLTYKESKKVQGLKEIYSSRILDCYKRNRDLIYKQFDEYVEEIRKSNFKGLLRFTID